VTDATEGEKDNIWTRLRRRKVVQWGIAYAAGAWGLLQGLEYVSSTFDWPRQIQQLATLALLVGLWGSGISDVAIFALRGDSATALAKLREAERAGWRGPLWRYYRDIDPNLASIRNEPEFKEIFADIERDMARQRAALAASPKDAPLDLAPAH
jgi:hypothetical protein